MPQLTPDIPRLGRRNTKQRTAIVQVLLDLDRFCSAKTIHEELEARGHKVGLTTVYRTLQALVDAEAVDMLTTPAGQTLYRHCLTEEHHHHLVCTKCGLTHEIDGGPVETWAAAMARENGFELTGHDAEVYGVCPDCAKRLADSRTKEQA